MIQLCCLLLNVVIVFVVFHLIDIVTFV